MLAERSGRGRGWLWLSASAQVLAILGCAGPVLADTTVNGGSSPVKTSTAAAGAPDNVVQSGTLTTAGGPAITLDSDNTVTNSGTIQAQDVDNVAGILALGGHTGAITNSGAITLNETAATTTTNSAGDVVGPFAKGAGRFGIVVQGPGVFTGGITNTGTITIQGADSAGISVGAALTGSIGTSGAITATGDRSLGLSTSAPVGGDITVGGAITATGADARAIAIGDDVGGGVSISSTVSATGYHSAARASATAQIADQDANDAAQGGSAVSIAGSLGRGLLISAPPTTVSTSVTDANGDGIADASETTGAVTSSGSAPAILVGAAGRDISLGVVGTGDSAYGLVIGGSVSGAGLRDGVSATGVQLAVDRGGPVSLAQGMHVIGSLGAASYDADATALHLLAGANAPVLANSGTLTATVTASGAAWSNARAVVVEPGAALTTVLNGGILRATVQGPSGDAVAILDKAGSLTHLENTGTILAQTIAASGATAAPTGAAVAIEDSANTTGVSILSYAASGGTSPTIDGAIRLGSGDDSLDVRAGVVAGDLSFGAGHNSLSISGGAAVSGGLTATGGTLALSVGQGSLQINSASKINLTSLDLASTSTLVFSVDHAAGQATELDVAGAANIAAGAKIGVRMTSIQNGEATYTLVRASQLNAGALDESLLASTPYLYASRLVVDPAAGTVSVDLARKTAAQLALPSSIAGAYEPVVAAIGSDANLGAGLLAQTSRGGFLSAYQQLLPEHSGGVFRIVSEGTEAFGRPLDDRQGGGGGGAWAQEVDFVARTGSTADLAGYNSWGVGLVGGYELPASPVGVFGVTVGGVSGELRPDRSADATDAFANVVELGGYWRGSLGRFAANARVAGDYLMATSHRAANFTTAATGDTKAHWNGWGVTSRLRVSYEADWNALYLRPQAGVDFLQLHEGGYTEGGGGALDLAVGSRKTDELSAFGGLAIGAVFGTQTAFWGPELMVGYRDAVSRTVGATTARFVAGGDAFTVDPYPLPGGGMVARVALKSESGPAAFSLEAGGEKRGRLNVLDAKIAAHVSF